MIAIVDYGMGNLRSVQKAFERVGAEAEITASAERILQADGVVLPGVGAFGQAMQNLSNAGLVDVLRQVAARRPFLGICLGLQLLYEESEEMGHHRGLGILRGRVVRFQGTLKVPHMGWNQIRLVCPAPILAGVPDGSFAYFAHSYYVVPDDASDIVATTTYGVSFASIVGRGMVFGIQLHPEKSQTVGLRILENFATLLTKSS